MKNKKIGNVIMFIIFIIIGAGGGFLLATYINEHDLSFLELLYAFVWLAIGYLIGIVVHESGHLVTGRKSGYEFVSFRVGSITWIKENGKLKQKKFNIQGTGGQCIMMPPDIENPEDVPFVLYFLGGGLFNLISAAIFIPIGILIPNFYASMPAFMFGAASFIQGLINLIPLNLTVPNDGYQIVIFSRSKEERILFYKHLRINGLLYQGYTPAEMPEKMFDFGENSRGLSELIHASLYIDKKDFKTAEALVKSAIESGKLLSIYEYEAKTELLFCKIMNSAPENEINELYDKSLKEYIRASGKTQIAKHRIMYAYYLLFANDKEAAQKEYETALAMKETYPSAGEIKSELSVIEYVKNYYL